jgi:hypothetical protein
MDKSEDCKKHAKKRNKFAEKIQKLITHQGNSDLKCIKKYTICRKYFHLLARYYTLSVEWLE